MSVKFFAILYQIMDARQSVKREYTKPETASCSNVRKQGKKAQEHELKIRTLLQYLLSLPGDKLERIYSYPATCVAIYRDLPELARLFVMRLVFIEQPVPRGLVLTWVQQQKRQKAIEITEIMSALQLWHMHTIQGGLQAWELCATFKTTIKQTLLGGGKTWEVCRQHPYDHTKDRDLDFLDAYAMSRWRTILHFLVGLNKDTCTQTEGEGMSQDAVHILLRADLMRNDDKSGITLTPRGFQFLLLDTQTQIWLFVLEYIDSCEQRGLDIAECLSVLFQLSLATPGRYYTTNNFTKSMLVFLQHLREIGLVYQRKRKEGRFYPTRLSTSINNSAGTSLHAYHKPAAAAAAAAATSNSASLDLQSQLTGFIIVETNFRVYAHTDSQLHLAVLGLFTKLLYRFPGMLVGVLTRDSLRQAFRVGITAELIVRFLQQYAHPQMHKKDAPESEDFLMPPNVVDQIRLWENERNRLIFTESMIYDSFLSHNDYLTLSEYARSINALVWESPKSRIMVCSMDGHNLVKRFWQRYSSKVRK